jgi:hypothetical protein
MITDFLLIYEEQNMLISKESKIFFEKLKYFDITKLHTYEIKNHNQKPRYLFHYLQILH